MRADSDYFAEPFDTLTITWDLPEFSCGSLFVEPGWNLLSTPYYNPGGNPGSVFPGAFAGPYGYDASSGAYFTAHNVEPGVGYWLFYDEVRAIPSVGAPVYRYGTSVRRGWNLVGATADTIAFDDVAVDPPTDIIQMFRWDTETGEYIDTDTLVPGKGYWMLINGDGVLWAPE